jgi:uncharacterized protein (UPF0335 family)
VALPSLGALWRFARKVEDLFALQNANQASLEAVAQQLHDLDTRMTRLESEQARLITEARSAATTSASTVAAAVISDTVTRLTRLESRVDQMDRPHLLPAIG